MSDTRKATPPAAYRVRFVRLGHLHGRCAPSPLGVVLGYHAPRVLALLTNPCLAHANCGAPSSLLPPLCPPWGVGARSRQRPCRSRSVFRPDPRQHAPCHVCVVPSL
eukprot:scaffold5991_cov102-Isochrysis_galbana.AAC.2